MQFIDDQWHLFRGAHQKCGQADRIGIFLDGGVDDCLGGDLLAQVNDLKAIIAQDRLDEILANIMHVAVNGSEDDLSFGCPFSPLKIFFQPCDSFLHHLGRLKHEGQDQLACAKFIANLFHRGEQGVIQNVDGRVVESVESSLIPCTSPTGRRLSPLSQWERARVREPSSFI